MAIPTEVITKVNRGLQPVALSLLIVYVVFQFILDFQTGATSNSTKSSYDAQVLEILNRTSTSLVLLTENTRQLSEIQLHMKAELDQATETLHKISREQLTRDEFLREQARQKN